MGLVGSEKFEVRSLNGWFGEACGEGSGERGEGSEKFEVRSLK
jgi:hypothetical protein